jgi:hypothetical protein
VVVFVVVVCFIFSTIVAIVVVEWPKNLIPEQSSGNA